MAKNTTHNRSDTVILKDLINGSSCTIITQHNLNTDPMHKLSLNSKSLFKGIDRFIFSNTLRQFIINADTKIGLRRSNINSAAFYIRNLIVTIVNGSILSRPSKITGKSILCNFKSIQYTVKVIIGKIYTGIMHTLTGRKICQLMKKIHPGKSTIFLKITAAFTGEINTDTHKQIDFGKITAKIFRIIRTSRDTHIMGSILQRISIQEFPLLVPDTGSRKAKKNIDFGKGKSMQSEGQPVYKTPG